MIDFNMIVNGFQDIINWIMEHPYTSFAIGLVITGMIIIIVANLKSKSIKHTRFFTKST